MAGDDAGRIANDGGDSPAQNESPVLIQSEADYSSVIRGLVFVISPRWQAGRAACA
jgi:hypothetical protein